MTSIKIKDPNPLDFFNLRQPKKPPPHFEYINIPMSYNLEHVISKWILYHLKSRFYVGKGIFINRENKILDCLKIGFEDPKELSYFTLACPHLKYK